MTLPRLYPVQYEPLLRVALDEDLGRAGDITSDTVVPASAKAIAKVVFRGTGVVAGLDVAMHAFRLLDPTLEIDLWLADGRDAEAGSVVARVSGSARPILAAERTAMNLLGHLCGIATATSGIREALHGTRAKVVCTRKTLPGLRALEKYAVRCGGGANHRFGLDDAVLIKDNHLAVVDSVKTAIARARKGVGHLVKIEVEITRPEQIEEAIAAGADALLLDNMSIEELGAAVERIAGRVLTEASGGITPANARAVAETGVDLLSIGALTHSSPALDVALDFD